VALRHVASGYEEQGIHLVQCLDIIRRCALNLTHDGLHSRQVLDLADMLTDGSATYAEVRNVLQQIQRNYQHTLRRVIAPFERMRDRLELDAEELRIALANMQRFLHDLNSMAYFTDLARAHIERAVQDQDARIDGQAVTSRAVPEAGQIVHLSHRGQIAELVVGTDSACNLRSCYGGKGSGLIYISYLNIPTPDGFVIPTAAAKRRAATGDDTWLEEALREHLATLESDVARRESVPRRFGHPEQPLLLAVRGGSVFSMPGILTTVLFVGMNDRIAERLAEQDPWHAYDSYRRFLASYAQAAWRIDVEKYSLVDAAKERYGAKYKQDLPWEAMREIAVESRRRIEREGHGEALGRLLEDPSSQLVGAVRAVMDSWNSETAHRYRALKGICDSWQTAVIVQVMASGNHSNEEIKIGMDETRASLTGVIPRTVVSDLGVREITGEFKFSASGDDLVGGLTTSESFLPFEELGSYMPMLSRRLRHTVARLRRLMGTDQEIEFTVDRGVLSVLQSRAAEVGKNRENPSFSEPGEVATHGVGIRGSAFRGVAAFDEADYQELRAQRLENREDVDGILILLENPTPADIPLVISCEGLLAAKGGSTSHAAIAINAIEQEDYSAVMSADGLHVNALKHEATITGPDGRVIAQIRKGDVVSIDGTSGAVYVGSRTLART
jgi:pyruvate, orthophosphate dikinase